METANSLVGTVFNKLTLVEKTKAGWLCFCECGGTAIVKLYQLKNGNNKSCGCMMRATRATIGDLNKTHGLANSRISGYRSRAYGIWQAMKDRCTNKNREDYHRYGGRGISVCARWVNDFEAFYQDMGEPPPGMTIERNNNDEGYSPENCRWATRAEQGKNTANVKYVEIQGVTKPLSQWLKETGVLRGTYYHRLYAGWTQEEAILGKNKSTPT